MRWLPVLGLVLSGCSTCGGSGPAVPFGLDGSTEAPGVERPQPENRAERPDEGRAFPAGTTRVDIEGAPVEDEGSLRSLWVHDVDGDGDRDVVAIVDAPVRVLFFRRDGARFADPRVLSQAPTAEGCALSAASFSGLGQRLLASAEIACEENPAEASSERFVLGTDRTPRALVHLGVLAEEGRAPGDVTLALDVDDRDEDGRDDLVAEVGVSRGGRDASLSLIWLDRPSGLARESAEPEHTLNERSREALRRLRGAPSEALSRSEDVISLFEALCREGSIARLRVGNAPGLPCGQSNGAGRAATTIVRAHAALGETMAALDELARLERPGLLINDERREYARNALSNARTTRGVTMREGPTFAAAEGGGALLSALAFVDESHVLLRGSSPRTWDLSTGETTPSEPANADRRVRDPGGRFTAQIRSSCQEGITLQIGGGGGTRQVGELVPPPPQCSAEMATGTYAGGWHILGWPPQGVLAARGAELRLFPLDIEGLATSPPVTLDPSTPPPAPLPAGAITADGRFHVELRGPGVILHPVRRDAEPELLWPEGWASLDGEVTDAAVSPSGRRVAVLRGGRVYLIEKEAD